MHIPDGYLSPSTCAVLYGAAAPFWYTALQRVKKSLTTRLVPLLSVMAALSFVIMMFNLPLPGGTTGHAVGVGIATIILGPWASILAISIALAIQAVFFGDGGITTLGANCFNMAIVGSLVAYAVYRLAAGRAALTSSRRVVAAALAGYTAINASAFCAAVEFGIQPLFFKDPSGAPLYAPYPLSIAIPAMMIGHLTFAGLAELVLAGGSGGLLPAHQPLASEAHCARQLGGRAARLRAVKAKACGEPCARCGSALALLMVLTPLGILAAGTAWGEWSAQGFFQSASAREDGRGLAERRTCPSEPPRGLERLSIIVDRALPAICAVVCAPPGGGLRALRHVRFRRHHSGVARCGVAGCRGKRRRSQETRSQVPGVSDLPRKRGAGRFARHSSLVTCHCS